MLIAETKARGPALDLNLVDGVSVLVLAVIMTMTTVVILMKLITLIRIHQ